MAKGEQRGNREKKKPKGKAEDHCRRTKHEESYAAGNGKIEKEVTAVEPTANTTHQSMMPFKGSTNAWMKTPSIRVCAKSAIVGASSLPRN